MHLHGFVTIDEYTTKCGICQLGAVMPVGETRPAKQADGEPEHKGFRDPDIIADHYVVKDPVCGLSGYGNEAVPI